VEYTKTKLDNRAPEMSGALLSEHQIAAYQQLYKARFGVELTEGEALEKGLRILNLLKVVLIENKKHAKKPLLLYRY
jgi:hypothetical protein